MIAPVPGGGLGGVQARVAELQARLASLSADQRAPTASPTAASAPVGFAPSSTGPVAGAPSTVRAQAGASGAWSARLPDAAQPWVDDITVAAERHGLDPRLLASLVWSESGFRPDAVSHAGAIGLAQLMPATAAGMGIDPHDPLQNLDGGARFLKAQLDRFGRPDLALAAYNAGPARVAQAGGIPQITETRAYVAQVMSRYEDLR